MEYSFKTYLGPSFEKFNLTWIHKLLSLKYPEIELKNGVIFNDQAKVVNKSDQFEIDIYSKDPLVIAECTTFLNHDENIFLLLNVKIIIFLNNCVY